MCKADRLYCCAFLSSLYLSCPYPTGSIAITPSCHKNVNISGGTFTLSQGWAPGSILTYSCPLGYYPVPATRLCKLNGQWQTSSRSGRLTKAICKREISLALTSVPLAASPALSAVAQAGGLTHLEGVGRMAKLAL